jgi:CelD/BcsL family acetyltransferase involved in cellulose biosynthesis
MVGARTWAEAGATPSRNVVARAQPGAEFRSCRVWSGSGVEAYAWLCGEALHSPSQSAAWIKAWASSMKPDYIVAAISENGEAVFAVALEVTRAGPFKIARFMGGKHANSNFPPATPDFTTSATAENFVALFKAISQARPDIDIIALERMVAEFEGVSNPLHAMPHSTSPNVSLEVDLSPGFDAIAGRSKKLRSKHRWQIRKFEAAGGHRRIEAGTRQEVERLLSEFFRQKEVRLKKMGIANVFGDPAIQAFFKELFERSLTQEIPAFVLHALEVGGKLRAITGSSRSGKRIACDLVSIAEDEIMSTRPGEFLFYDNIEEACAQGLEVYDFGVGDEPHKRRWCDVEVRHFDVVVPLGLKGRLLAHALQAAKGLKRYVRNTPALWKIVKSLRRRVAAEKPESADQDD